MNNAFTQSDFRHVRRRSLKAALFSAPILALAACEQKVDVEEPEVPASEHDIDEGPAVTHRPAYIGVWAAEPGLCLVEPGVTDPGPIEITATQFIGYENICDVTSAEEGTDGGYRLSMTCNAEGTTVEEIADLDVDGDTLRLSRNGGEAVEFVRCDGDDENGENE